MHICLGTFIRHQFFDLLSLLKLVACLMLILMQGYALIPRSTKHICLDTFIKPIYLICESSISSAIGYVRNPTVDVKL
jgi:hypothetical protein